MGCKTPTVEPGRGFAHSVAMRLPRSLSFVALIALASCVGPPTPPRPTPRPVAIPTRTALPPAPTGSDWRDWPLTPGDWVYRQDGRGSIALFGATGMDAALTLRCDRTAGLVYLSRAGVAAAPLTIRTSTTVRTMTVAPTGGTTPYVALSLSSRDPLLEAMGFSRGRFIVEQPGQPPLVVPAWAEIERVTEDCRR